MPFLKEAILQILKIFLFELWTHFFNLKGVNVWGHIGGLPELFSKHFVLSLQTTLSGQWAVIRLLGRTTRWNPSLTSNISANRTCCWSSQYMQKRICHWPLWQEWAAVYWKGVSLRFSFICKKNFLSFPGLVGDSVEYFCCIKLREMQRAYRGKKELVNRVHLNNTCVLIVK